jgi:tRNA modification GTPase
MIRISGEDALGVADRIYRGKEKPSEFPSHAQRLGEIFEEDQLIDQVMVSGPIVPPASYTGEDLVEVTWPWWNPCDRPGP